MEKALKPDCCCFFGVFQQHLESVGVLRWWAKGVVQEYISDWVPARKISKRKNTCTIQLTGRSIHWNSTERNTRADSSSNEKLQPSMVLHSGLRTDDNEKNLDPFAALMTSLTTTKRTFILSLPLWRPWWRVLYLPVRRHRTTCWTSGFSCARSWEPELNKTNVWGWPNPSARPFFEETTSATQILWQRKG